MQRAHIHVQQDAIDNFIGFNSRVFVKRSDGGETPAFVCRYDAEEGYYVVELESRGSGHFKPVTSDMIRAAPPEPDVPLFDYESTCASTVKSFDMSTRSAFDMSTRSVTA